VNAYAPGLVSVFKITSPNAGIIAEERVFLHDAEEQMEAGKRNY
jgi:hypothetical protein